MLSMNNEMSASMFEAKKTNDYDEVIFCIKVFILLFKFFYSYLVNPSRLKYDIRRFHFPYQMLRKMRKKYVQFFILFSSKFS